MNSLCSLGASSPGASGPRGLRASGDTKPTGQQASAAPGVNSRVTSMDSEGKGLHEACSASPGSRWLRGWETQLWSEQLQAPPRTSQACELPLASPLRTVCKRERDIQEECHVLKEALPRLDRKFAQPIECLIPVLLLLVSRKKCSRGRGCEAGGRGEG